MEWWDYIEIIYWLCIGGMIGDWSNLIERRLTSEKSI